MRIYVEELVGTIDFDKMTLIDAKAKIDEILEKHPNSYFRNRYIGYDGAYKIEIYYMRKETDIEYSERLKKQQRAEIQEKKQKEKRIKQLEIELARLKS